MNIEYINGYINGLSAFCIGCNFVPVFGAKYHKKYNLGLKESIKINIAPSIASEFTTLDSKLADKHVLKIIQNCIGNNIFRDSRNRPQEEIPYTCRTISEEIVELISMTIGNIHEVMSFSIRGEDYGYATKAIALGSKSSYIFIYFGNWD